jgi:hypothetical protein
MNAREESVYSNISEQNTDKSNRGEDGSGFSLPAAAEPEMQIDSVNDPCNERPGLFRVP